ncbi:ATP-binding protein [Verrucomicrobiales bacterium BCK34]|nr:ATP-binding protein [Verrucomicrobiales bacterium BCK34]
MTSDSRLIRDVLAHRRWATQRRVERLAVIIVAGIIGMLGLLVIIGWLVKSQQMVQISPGFAPMQFNTALMFMIVSVGAISGVTLRKGAAIGCALVVFVFCAMTIVQYLLHCDFGLDTIFIDPFVVERTSHPGRMAPNTGICFMLGSLAVIGLSLGERGLRLNSMAGSVILAISILSLYGYVTHTEKAYGWGDLTRMALHTSVAFFLLALIFMVEGWRRFRIGDDGKKLPGWLPCMSAILVFSVGLGVWNSIVVLEEKAVADETVVRANLIREKFGLGMESYVEALGRMADRFDEGTRGGRWQADAANYIKDLPGLYAVAIVTESQAVWRIEVASEAKLEIVRAFPRNKFTPVDRQIVSVFSDGNWNSGDFAVFVKLNGVLASGESGYLACFFHGEPFFEASFGFSEEGYRYLVLDGDGAVLAGSRPGESEPSTPVTLPLETYGGGWEVLVFPKDSSSVTNLGVRLSTLTLLVTILVSVLVFLLIKLALRNYHTGLDRSDEELRRANTELETMLYIVSHDLREPVRSITSFSSILEERYRESLDEGGCDLLMRIVRSGERMEMLLADVVKVSRADRMVKLDTKVDLGEIVAEQLALLVDRIEGKKASVSVDEGLEVVSGDRVWIGQAVSNLISNAVKFSRENEAPEINVAGYSGKEGVGIVVRDRGCGLPENADDRLYDLFRRGVSRKVAGTGVGLAIVKRVAQKHGGDSWFRNRPGGGTEFFVTFGRSSA